MKKIMIGLMLAVMLMMPFAAAAGKGASGANGGTATVQAIAAKAVDAGDMEAVKATVKEKVREVKAIREEIRANNQERKQQRETIKEQLKQCKGSETEDCKQTRKQAKTEAVGQLGQMSDEVTAVLTRTRERVMNSNMNEETKQRLLEKLDAEIQTMQQAKENLAGLNEESSAKDIKDAMRRVQHSWSTAQDEVRNSVQAAAGLKVANVLRKSEHLVEKLDALKQKLAEQGKDVSSVATEEFADTVKKAKDLYEEAVQLRNEAMTKTGEEKTQMLKEASEKLRESHKVIKQAHEQLKGIVKQLREQAGKALTELDTSKVEEVSDPDEVAETAEPAETEGNTTQAI